MTALFQSFPAPAKLNLFLHITGRRTDGYHLLQSVFRLIDRNDVLHLRPTDDGNIRRIHDIHGIAEENDLCVRAARLLQQHTGCRQGVDIRLEKILPMGGGLGGGSSDAATVLLALNRLWQLNLPRETLLALGLRLGADVPIFIFGENAGHCIARGMVCCAYARRACIDGRYICQSGIDKGHDSRENGGLFQGLRSQRPGTRSVPTLSRS